MRTDRFALGEPYEHVFFSAGSNDGAGARTCCAFGGQNLRDHAALGERACCAPSHLFQSRITGLSKLDELRIRIGSGIRREKTSLIRQNHEHISFHKVRHQSAQRIVVAHFDFFGHHGVILIDNGNDAESQQFNERHAGIQILLSVRQIGVGKEHLSGLDAVTAEMFFIGLCKSHLSHRGGSLKLTDASRSSFPADTKHALGNSARAHQEHFAAHRAERGNLTGPTLDRTNIKTASVIGNQCAPNLDNNATRLFKKRFLTDHGVFSYGNCTTGKPLTRGLMRLSDLKLMFESMRCRIVRFGILPLFIKTLIVEKRAFGAAVFVDLLSKRIEKCGQTLTRCS